MTVQAFATAASASTLRGADTDELNATYLQASIEAARARIGQVPGAGLIRGVWRYGGATYAFRDDATGVKCGMWRESQNGWDEVDLGWTLPFDSGVGQFEEGDIITGDLSGATATVKRVVLQSGDWSTGDGAGFLSIAGITGSFIADESITAPGGAFSSAFSSAFDTIADAKTTGVAELNQFAPGGYFEFDNYAFLATSASLRMYGCDGVSDAFEFDGETLTWIRPSGKTDKPKYIGGNANHLVLTYPGGIITISSIGEPLVFLSTTGAVEFGLGDDCTGLVPEYLGTCVIYGRNRTAILYGSSAADFALKTISLEAGAFDRTAQQLVQAVAVDDRGIKSVQAVQQYGDFALGSMSEKVRPWLEKKKAGHNVPTITATQRVRKKDQYRVFFSDGTALIMSLAKSKPEFLFINYGIVVYRAVSAEDADGSERLFLTSDDGYVYEADAGTSLDGSNMLGFIRFAFDHQGAPSQNKRYAKVNIEAEVDEATTLYVSANYNYGRSAADTPEQSFSMTGGGGFFDELNWNEFYWDAAVTGQAEAHIAGFGQNISVVIASEGIYEKPHVLQAKTIHYSGRGMKR